jgi:C4-dicarboxylate transporter, DctQ subunit
MMTDETRPDRAQGDAHFLMRALDRIEKFVVVLFLFLIVGLIFSGVLSRFVFHYSIAFTEELARFLFVWGALLGASSAFKTGEHGGIPLIVNKFSPGGRRFIEIFVAAGVLVFMAYLVYMTGVSTLKSYASGQISTTTEIPVWTINFGMMMAFLIGVIRCIQGFFLGAFKPELPAVDTLKTEG